MHSKDLNQNTFRASNESSFSAEILIQRKHLLYISAGQYIMGKKANWFNCGHGANESISRAEVCFVAISDFYTAWIMHYIVTDFHVPDIWLKKTSQKQRFLHTLIFCHSVYYNMRKVMTAHPSYTASISLFQVSMFCLCIAIQLALSV